MPVPGASAIAINLALRHSVVLWGRKNSVIVDAGNTRQNKVGLPGFVLPDPLQLTADFEKAVAHASGEDGLAIVATSVAGLREVAGNLRNSGIANLIWLCKGFEENTGLMPSQVVSEVTANRLNTGVLSGPSFAQEVAARFALCTDDRLEIFRSPPAGDRCHQWRQHAHLFQ